MAVNPTYAARASADSAQAPVAITRPCCANIVEYIANRNASASATREMMKVRHAGLSVLARARCSHAEKRSLPEACFVIGLERMNGFYRVSDFKDLAHEAASRGSLAQT